MPLLIMHNVHAKMQTAWRLLSRDCFSVINSNVNYLVVIDFVTQYFRCSVQTSVAVIFVRVKQYLQEYDMAVLITRGITQQRRRCNTLGVLET